MWLEDNTEEAGSSSIQDYPEVNNSKKSVDIRKDSKRKKSKSQDKHKKIKEDDTKHKKSKKSKNKKEKKSSDYEETAGISTPSKEILPELRNDLVITKNSLNSIQPLIAYEELSKNKTISMMYELKQIADDTSKIIVSILITNVGQKLVKEIRFDITDTSTLKLMKNVGILFYVIFFCMVIEYRKNEFKVINFIENSDYLFNRNLIYFFFFFFTFTDWR